MHSLLFGFFLALTLVATIDGALNLSSNERPRIPVQEGEIPWDPPPVELACPQGFFSLGDSCYAVFDEDSYMLWWDDAQTFCGSLAAGGRLVELETAEELALVKNHLLESDYDCGDHSWYWIGGDEIGDTNTFKWASSGQMIDASDWYPGEPNNSGSGDAIFLACPAPYNWQWIDWGKLNSRRPICEAPPIEV
ncbi:unnamed protein product [Cyprideis torosa]|uniref:Uncharacterized protein n=1 Tax=Cyprideis torosa TaxID=163714 RepID=A0A7R8WWC4_9CRUS|nr:unnamed protein product [Cyprideis torosa]CAG0908193.1 unnamed protein product [Cyprideis torosa]